MPRDYIQRLFASWRADTGLVASPPIGCRPDGLWAEVECAFLNTYQARWQYIVDTFGFGFAQGKTMLWRRADLDAAGGIEALAKEVAEDAAATKVVRDAGLQSAAGRSAVGAAARPAQRRRSVEPAIALGAAAARQLPALFPAGNSVGRRAADDRASHSWQPPLAGRRRSASARSARSGTAPKWRSPPPPAGTVRRFIRFTVWCAICCCRRCLSARCAATTSSGAAMKCRSSACGQRRRVMARVRPRMHGCRRRQPAAAALAARTRFSER